MPGAYNLTLHVNQQRLSDTLIHFLAPPDDPRGSLACLAPEHVAELVVEERALHALGQRGLDVADFLADLVPLVGHGVGGRRVLHGVEDQRFAGARVAAQEVRVGGLLELLADAVGDLFLHLLRGRARPQGLDDHHAEREGRIFRLRQLGIRQHAEQRHQRNDEDHQRLVAQRPGRQVELAFFVAVARLPIRRAHDAKSSGCSGGTVRTFSPADTVCTPCQTRRSPAFTPPASVTVRAS
ncbi:hypothetical protein G6F68_012828 [Rhizopus microsporus]|nr:hypothetical protein G6F68_012828 [Rhizopus microsporus]